MSGKPIISDKGNSVKIGEKIIWNEYLRKKIESEEFKLQIKNKGYYLSSAGAFRTSIYKEDGTQFTSSTAFFLSIDFWEDQPPALKQKGYVCSEIHCTLLTNQYDFRLNLNASQQWIISS